MKFVSLAPTGPSRLSKEHARLRHSKSKKGEGSRPLPSPPSSSPRRPCRPTPAHRGGDETGLAAKRKLVPRRGDTPHRDDARYRRSRSTKAGRPTEACRAHHARRRSPTMRHTPRRCALLPQTGRRPGRRPRTGHVRPVFVTESHAIGEMQWIGCFRHSFAIRRKCERGDEPVSRPFSRPSSCASHRGNGPPSPV